MQNNPNYPPGQPAYPSPPYQQQPPYPPMTGPPRRRRRWPWILLGIFIILGALIVYAGQGGNSQTSTTPAATQVLVGSTPVVTQAPATIPTPAHALTWTTIQTFKGNGSKKTQTFQISDNWRIKWTCDPASFGGSQFNIIIEVDNADGSYADLLVNTMCKPGNVSDVSYETAGGTYLLNITSEGDWVIEVQTQK